MHINPQIGHNARFRWPSKLIGWVPESVISMDQNTQMNNIVSVGVGERLANEVKYTVYEIP